MNYQWSAATPSAHMGYSRGREILIAGYLSLGSCDQRIASATESFDNDGITPTHLSGKPGGVAPGQTIDRKLRIGAQSRSEIPSRPSRSRFSIWWCRQKPLTTPSFSLAAAMAQPPITPGAGVGRQRAQVKASRPALASAQSDNR